MPANVTGMLERRRVKKGFPAAERPTVLLPEPGKLLFSALKSEAVTERRRALLGKVCEVILLVDSCIDGQKMSGLGQW